MNIKEIKGKVANIVEAAATVGGVLFIPATLIWAFYSEMQDWETDPHNCEYNPCYWGCSETDNADEYAELCEIQQCSEDPYLPQCKSNKYDYLRNENNEQEPVDERIKDAQKQIEETQKKSELKSTAPKDICLDNYLGAKYKKGKCEFPVYERMNGRAGLEKKFESCQINKIIAGKGNTATAHAVCRGVPSIINVKRFYQKGR